MARTQEGCGGYLTIFLSLVLTVLLSLCLALIVSARESTRRMTAEYVTDIAMNNVLAEYHRELLEQYDLFFVDTSYGTEAASYENTEARLEEYAAYNLGDEGLFLPFLYRDTLKMEAEEVNIEELSVATDQEGKVLRRQAVEVMREKVGITYLEKISEWLTVVDAYELDSRDILAEEKAASEELMEWDGAILETAAGEKELSVEVPGEEIVSMWESGILNFVVEDVTELSGRKVGGDAYVSERELLTGTGLPDVTEFGDGWLEQLLFHEYIMKYTGRYGQEKAEGLLQYQTEYILCGHHSDLDNLKSMVYRLLAFRAAADTVYLLSDKEKMNLVQGIASVLAVLLGVPDLDDLFKTILTLVWAMAESMYDVEQLLKGNRIPLLKTKKDWHYDIGAILDFSWISGDDEGSGLCYEEYQRIFLCLQSKKTTTLRLMDIMEMDIRQTAGNRYFRMDGCVDSLKAAFQYRTRDEHCYIVTRRYGY